MSGVSLLSAPARNGRLVISNDAIVPLPADGGIHKAGNTAPPSDECTPTPGPRISIQPLGLGHLEAPWQTDWPIKTKNENGCDG